MSVECVDVLAIIEAVFLGGGNFLYWVLSAEGVCLVHWAVILAGSWRRMLRYGSKVMHLNLCL